MQVTVFGASGKVGSIIVDKLLQDGVKVTAFVHEESSFAPSELLVEI